MATHPAVEAALLAELAGLGLAASPEAPQPGQIKWEHLAQVTVRLAGWLASWLASWRTVHAVLACI